VTREYPPNGTFETVSVSRIGVPEYGFIQRQGEFLGDRQGHSVAFAAPVGSGARRKEATRGSGRPLPLILLAFCQNARPHETTSSRYRLSVICQSISPLSALLISSAPTRLIVQPFSGSVLASWPAARV